MLSAFGVEHIAKADRKYKRDAGGRFAKIDQRKFKGTFKFVDDPLWNQQINADIDRIAQEPLDENLPSWIRDSQREEDDSTLMYLKWLDSPSGPFSETFGDTEGTEKVGGYLDHVTGTERAYGSLEVPEKLSSQPSEPLEEEIEIALGDWNDEYENIDWGHGLVTFEDWLKGHRVHEDASGNLWVKKEHKNGKLEVIKEPDFLRPRIAEGKKKHNYKTARAEDINQMQNEQKYRGLNDNNHVGGMWEYPNKEAYEKSKKDPENKHLYGIEKAAHLREVIKKNFSSAFGIQTYA